MPRGRRGEELAPECEDFLLRWQRVEQRLTRQQRCAKACGGSASTILWRTRLTRLLMLHSAVSLVRPGFPTSSHASATGMPLTTSCTAMSYSSPLVGGILPGKEQTQAQSLCTRVEKLMAARRGLCVK